MRAEDLVDDVRVVVHLLVHHEPQDTHLRRTPVVQLDRTLDVLLFVTERVPVLLERVDHGHVPWEGALLLVHDLVQSTRHSTYYLNALYIIQVNISTRSALDISEVHMFDSVHQVTAEEMVSFESSLEDISQNRLVSLATLMAAIQH